MRTKGRHGPNGRRIGWRLVRCSWLRNDSAAAVTRLLTRGGKLDRVNTDTRGTISPPERARRIPTAARSPSSTPRLADRVQAAATRLRSEVNILSQIPDNSVALNDARAAWV